jgi:hypothetical protein
MRAVERYVQAGFFDLLFMPMGGVGLPEIEATAAVLPKLREVG